jgi:hypothetical protein
VEADYMDEVEVIDNGGGNYTVRNKDTSDGVGLIVGVIVVIVVFVFIGILEGLMEIGNKLEESANVGLSELEILAKDNNSIDLFSAPCDGGVNYTYNSGLGDDTLLKRSQTYYSDFNGERHVNCYSIFCKNDNSYFAWMVNGSFSTLSGNLYAAKNEMPCWIEIYGDGKLLYTSPQLSGEQVSCTFSIRLEGVSQLTICPRASGTASAESGWLITDGFTLSK